MLNLAFLRLDLFTTVENLITYPEICTMYRVRYARAYWDQNGRGLARPSEHHFEGRQPSGTLEKDSSPVCNNSLVTITYSRFLCDIGPKFWLTVTWDEF